MRSSLFAAGKNTQLSQWFGAPKGSTRQAGVGTISRIRGLRIRSNIPVPASKWKVYTHFKRDAALAGITAFAVTLSEKGKYVINIHHTRGFFECVFDLLGLSPRSKNLAS